MKANALALLTVALAVAGAVFSPAFAHEQPSNAESDRFVSVTTRDTVQRFSAIQLNGLIVNSDADTQRHADLPIAGERTRAEVLAELRSGTRPCPVIGVERIARVTAAP
jgi:hypothetical protein